MPHDVLTKSQRIARCVLRRSLRVAAWGLTLVMFIWAAGAIGHLTLLPSLVVGLLGWAFLGGGLYLLWHEERKQQWLRKAAAAIVLVWLVSLLQRPSHDRVWDADHARLPEIAIDDGSVTIENFRHCRYRTELDYDTKYETFTFELSDLDSVWFVVQRFTGLEGLAHTFLSFGLDTDDGPEYFSVSIETRREAGEVYSPISGLFRQFELIYVIGDERDLIGVRTVMRPTDRVSMYRVNAAPEQVQELFRSIARRAERLREQPEFYHTFFNNCTNNLVLHTRELLHGTVSYYDPRIILPGFSDRAAYNSRLIGEEGESFDSLTAGSRIDERARAAGITDSFSHRIRIEPEE